MISMLYLAQVYSTYLCFQALTMPDYDPNRTIRVGFVTLAATVVDPILDWLPLWSYARTAGMVCFLLPLLAPQINRTDK